MKTAYACRLAGLLSVLIGFSGSVFAQPSIIPDSLTLIAHYPLQLHPDDSTTNYGPMQLINAPYGDGGIQLSGIYLNAVDPTNASQAITPQLDALNLDAFAFSVAFKMGETGYPILVGGENFRWMGAWVFSDSVLYMEANNYAFIERSEGKIDLDVWYTLTMTYSAAEQKGRWYLNETEVGSVDFVSDHGNDKTVGVTHFGLGEAFKGTLSNLRVYSYTGGMPTAVEEAAVPETFRLHAAYPNPFNPTTTITYDLPEAGAVTLFVYDVLGREVRRQLVGQQPAGASHRIAFEAQGLASGTYLYRVVARLADRQEMLTGRFVLLK